MSKTILITGASRGLGFCLTKKYLEDGDLVFAGVRDSSAPLLLELKKEYSEKLILVDLEVTDTISVQKAAFTVAQYTKSLDIIINNAAIHNATSFEQLELADIDDCLPVYNVNSLGPLRVVKEFIGFIRKSASAKIINISSESGSIGACTREKEFDYCMSKAALNMGTKLLANYLRKDKVVVLAVHPGWMRTDMGGCNADLDPYETAYRIVELIKGINSTDTPIFIDNKGDAFLW
jgi:NAD(P)-dependent dehydrogenase (short-subunit alcohol dehydrogenase family)